jgi:hypothetical protein
MATPAQITANQANARKSPGPTSLEGKAASSQNNFKHGFRAKFQMCGSEDPNEYRALLNALLEEHKPQTSTEQLLVENIAEHYWLVRRARNLQFLALETDVQVIQRVTLWQRYETQHDRAFHKCLAELRKIKSAKAVERGVEQKGTSTDLATRSESVLCASSREERRKEQIGFERQKQVEAAEARKQEAHAAKTRLTNAKAEELELDTAIKAMIQAPCPGNTTLDLKDLKRAIQIALCTLSAEKAEPIAA